MIYEEKWVIDKIIDRMIDRIDMNDTESMKEKINRVIDENRIEE